MNIYIDFDDTITASVDNVVRIINKRYNRNVKPQDIGKWDFSDVYPDIPLEDIVGVFGEKEFFKTLKLKNEGRAKAKNKKPSVSVMGPSGGEIRQCIL